jgi:hypothetical protein
MIRRCFRGWLIYFLAPVLFVYAANAALGQEQMGFSSNASNPVDVGMVALIAVPENYEGKFIRTHGFLCVEFEGDAVYLHEEDYRHGLTKNSLAIRLSKAQREQYKRLSLKYVLIEGILYAKGLEHTAEWSGALGKITRLEVWPIDRGAGGPR